MLVASPLLQMKPLCRKVDPKQRQYPEKTKGEASEDTVIWLNGLQLMGVFGRQTVGFRLYH